MLKGKVTERATAQRGLHGGFFHFDDDLRLECGGGQVEEVGWSGEPASRGSSEPRHKSESSEGGSENACAQLKQGVNGRYEWG